MTSVVEERVHRFLQHALFVVDDDVRRLELEKAAQAVVAVDDAAVEVVQVGRREAAAVERDERTQIRRDHRQHGKNHPFGTISGLDEALDDLEPARELDFRLLGARVRHLLLQFLHDFRQVQGSEHVAERLRAHFRDEGVFSVFLLRLRVFVFGKQLLRFERRLSGIDDQVLFIIDDGFELARRHVEQQPEAGRHRLEEPNVRNGNGELNVPHAAAAFPRDRDLDAAAVADHAFVLDAFVFAAGAFVVAHGTENPLTEKPARLRLERAVIDRLRIFDFSVRPLADHVGRSERDGHVVEILLRGIDFGICVINHCSVKVG